MAPDPSPFDRMPRKFFRKYLPDHASLRDHRHLRWAAPWLQHPNLWHLNRHSVAGGVAAGIIGGLIPGPVQIGTAIVLALIFRVNLPVAVATTLLSNPLTWPLIILAAVTIGEFLLGSRGAPLTPFSYDWSTQPWQDFLPAFWHWLLGLGEAFLLGQSILAASLAVLGYATVQLGWRWHLWAYLRRRARRPKPNR